MLLVFVCASHFYVFFFFVLRSSNTRTHIASQAERGTLIHTRADAHNRRAKCDVRAYAQKHKSKCNHNKRRRKINEHRRTMKGNLFESETWFLLCTFFSFLFTILFSCRVRVFFSFLHFGSTFDFTAISTADKTVIGERFATGMRSKCGVHRICLFTRTIYSAINYRIIIILANEKRPKSKWLHLNHWIAIAFISSAVKYALIDTMFSSCDLSMANIFSDDWWWVIELLTAHERIHVDSTKCNAAVRPQ